MKQLVICKDKDSIYVCDREDAKCCLEVNNIFLLVDLEKEVVKNENRKLLREIFNYEGKHPDFMIIKVENDKIVLELLEFKRTEKKEEILYAIVHQLLYFYSKLNRIFNRIDEYKLLVVVPCDSDELGKCCSLNSCNTYKKVNEIVKNFKKDKGERERYIKSLLDQQMKILIPQLLSDSKVLNSIDVACYKSL